MSDLMNPTPTYRTMPTVDPELGVVPSFLVSDKFWETKEEEFMYYVNQMRKEVRLNKMTRQEFMDSQLMKDMKFELVQN